LDECAEQNKFRRVEKGSYDNYLADLYKDLFAVPFNLNSG